MNLEEVIAKQAELKLGDDHLVYLEQTKWFCAHTDEERAEGLECMAECPINDWLESWGGPPEPLGFYIVVWEPDWEDWELIPV